MSTCTNFELREFIIVCILSVSSLISHTLKISYCRPFPMIGNFFANCFVHFEPYESIKGESSYDPKLDIPPYLVTGSMWEKEWKTGNPGGWKGVSLIRCFTKVLK